MVSSVEQRPTFQDAALHREIMRLREVDNHTNLFFLAVEYLSLVTVMAGAIVFAEYRDSWGLSLVLERAGIRDGDRLDRRHPAPARGTGARVFSLLVHEEPHSQRFDP